MNNVLHTIKEYYNQNMKIQVLSIFVAIILVMTLVYNLSTESNFSSIKSVEFNMTTSPIPKEPNPEEKNRPKKQSIPMSTQKVPEKIEDKRKNGVEPKDIATIRKEKFDNDIERKFSFESEF